MMPFKSEKQRKFMYAKHPTIAKRWTKKYGATPQPSQSSKRKKSSNGR